jgi:hypothetical protein
MTGDGGPSPDAAAQTVKALALIVVVVVVGFLVLHHNPGVTKNASKSTTTRKGAASAVSSTVPASTTTTVLIAPSSVKVQVLNGVSATASYGSEWSKKLQTTPGYDTLAADNASTTVAASEIYVLTPGYLPEALQLAHVVGIPASAVVTTIPPPASAPIPARDRTSANLVLVIGPNLVASA